MRRGLIRQLFILASAISLLLALATLILWARSYSIADHLTLNSTRYWRVKGTDETAADYRGLVALDTVGMNRGSIAFYHRRSTELSLGLQNVKEWSTTYPEGIVLLWEKKTPWVGPLQDNMPIFNVVDEHILIDRFGFFYGSCSIGGMFSGSIDFRDRIVCLPAWLFTLLAAWLPGYQLLSAVRSRRRRRTASCLRCGYDLTGNVSGTCPECGSPVPPTPEAAA
jgi:hypothetical protein